MLRHAAYRLCLILGTLSVKSGDIVRRYGCYGPNGLRGRVQAPTGAELSSFLVPKNGLDLGGRCTGPQPPSRLMCYTYNSSPSNMAKVALFLKQFLSKNDERSD